MPGKNEELVSFSEKQAANLVKLYQDAEGEIERLMLRAMDRGNNTDQLRSLQAGVRNIVKDLQNGAQTWCKTAIPLVYSKSLEDINQQLEKANILIQGAFGAIHQQAVQVLADNAFQRLVATAHVIGRRAEDHFRWAALESLKGSVIGYDTWKKAAQKFRDNLKAKGITGFTDAAGRSWNMTSYSKMVARTTTMEAHLEGTANRLIECGFDLVKISTHSNPCPYCAPWQGHTVSLTGKTEGYPTLAQAKEQGLFHPNCEHAYGLSVNLPVKVPTIRGGKFAADADVDHFGDIARFREKAGLPEFVSNKRTGTVSKAYLRDLDKSYYGTNSTMAEIGKRPPVGAPSNPIEYRQQLFKLLKSQGQLEEFDNLGQAQFLSHAEANSLARAYERVGGPLGKVDLYVDRATCWNCRDYLDTLMDVYGIDELRIFNQSKGSTVPYITVIK